MKTNVRLAVAAGLTALLFAVSPAAAQITTGEITGRVTDAQGSAVPGATVTAENPATGLQRTTISSATGDYTVSQLPPGIYTISAELQGFRRVTTSDIEVNVGTRRTLNLQLEIGALTETVEVTTEAALIETTKSEIAGVVTPTEIQNLPLLNRTFASLSVVMPEARPVGNFDPTKARMGSVAMSGGDGRQLDVNVDGGDNKDNVVGSLLQNFAYESIQEFQVLQHRWTAESGRAVGGVINVITKSGNNTLRGSLFGNGRNQDTRAHDFFENQLRASSPNFEKPAFSRQEFGGSIGGPVRQDNLFYFGALERFRERQNTPVRAAAIPHLEALQGAMGIAAVSEIPQPYDDTLLSVKVDHRLNERQSMSYRYSQQNNSSPNDQVGSPANTDLTGGNTTTNDLYSFLVNHNFTLGPTRLNQFSFHFQDFLNEKLSVTDTPNIVFPTVQTGANVNVPQATSVRKWQFRNDFTWHAGSHSLKSGVNYIRTDMGGFFYSALGYRVLFFDDPLTILGNQALYPQSFATPGAVRQITFSDGDGNFDLMGNQLALYVQDDWRYTDRLTLNLGLRWDGNMGFLPDQTQNRTIQLLQQLDDPRAREIAGDADRLRRRTPSWTEFQPRLGLAFDPRGDGRSVVRGGYGVFYDQVFLNLTLFSIQQARPTIFQQILGLTNSAVGVGQLANYRFGLDPLPGVPAGTTATDIARGAFGRINDPAMTDPYVHKLSLGFQHSLTPRWSVSSDYVHTRGENEPRVMVVNERIQDVCDPAFPGSAPDSPRCVRGANTRYFDAAFAAAGLGAGRLEQINMIGTTNSSRFDSWTTTVRGRLPWGQASLSYVLASSRSWGGQPTASYSGNAIATTPENQFRPEEWGPTRLDERHRIVASGVFNLPYQIQVAPLMQFATARPYSLNAGLDLDGDGLATNDRVCAGVDPRAVFDARGNSAAVLALNARGCPQMQVNSQRSGFIVNADGSLSEVSGRFFNVDVRLTKAVTIRGVNIKPYADFYNLFNTENLSLADRLGQSYATSQANYMQPVSLFGPGFGPPVGRPLTVVFGARLDF
jgi:hypothetical protein